MTGTVPGSKPYRDRLRAELMKAGMTGHCLTEQVGADLARQGMRPRQAWRYASELSQRVAAMRFNEVTGDLRTPMTTGRIWDFERWPDGGVRPTVRTLTILACVYGIALSAGHMSHEHGTNESAQRGSATAMNSPATHSIAVQPGTAAGEETACEPAPPVAGVPAAALPARPLPAGVRAGKWVPSDPEILRRVRAALGRL